jgi:raffinose/stachyose/melibiose transport system permease protein
MSQVAATAAIPVRKKKRDWERIVFMTLFLTPAVGLLLFYMYYPIEETFRLSFTNSKAIGAVDYIGLENYRRLFSDAEYRQGLINVLKWAIASVCIQIPLAFFVAYSLVVFANRINRGLRAIYYLANVLPSAITAMLGQFIFAPGFGVMNSLADALGWQWLADIDFLGNVNIAFWSIFAVATWAYVGFGTIYMMANIEQIPMEIREAAYLDGANRWQYAWRIVIPMVSLPLRILAILATVGSMKIFELPWLMTTGGPGYTTTTLGIVLYKKGFQQFLYGRASAVGVTIFLLSLVFTIVQFSTQVRERRAK